MNTDSIIKVDNLRKTYGSTVAVDNISFEVFEVEIFGMVGPNGAGKTTTIECIEGLRKYDSGSVNVLGKDPSKDGSALKPVIGIQLQQSELQQRIKVWEALDLYSSIYPKSTDWTILLDQLGLTEKRNEFFSKLSGGQKQRLFIALALVNDPVIVFLDELTTGLDPQARRAMWDLVENMKDRGKTVYLTTHFMEEAERLCDRVAIIDHGKIIALDTPADLIKNHSPDERIEFAAAGSFDPEDLKNLEGISKVEKTDDKFIIYGTGKNLMQNVVNYLSEKQINYSNFRSERSTLEDVFLKLTGREMRD
ncbi:ATP-binding cassette domain-containing protein [candidate division KSB1 bacterium]